MIFTSYIYLILLGVVLGIVIANLFKLWITPKTIENADQYVISELEDLIKRLKLKQ